MKTKEQSLDKIAKSLSGIDRGKGMVEEHLMRIADTLTEATKDGKPIIDSLKTVESGDAENSIVQKGSNAVAFGENSTAFGTSSTNAKDRGITEESTPEEIIQEWENSPGDDHELKFALAFGEASHVEGNNCLALGKNSHAEGNGTVAANNSSHTEGVKTFAQNEGEHSEGKYNKSNEGTISSVGIGSDDNTRKNAFEILSNGLMFIYGVNGYDGTKIDTSSTGNSLQAMLYQTSGPVNGSLFGWD